MGRLAIIGAGAAGLMAAVGASSAMKKTPHEIVIIEKNSRPARKLMITGKGRCNVTNNCDLPTLISNTPKNGKFLYSAFSSFLPQDVMSFFEDLGVSLKTERGNRVFPVSDKAVDIVDALVFAAKKDCRIIEGTVLHIREGTFGKKEIELTNGKVLEADAAILATGGMSYPVTGSTGDGYAIAKSLGHTVTDICPSLVPIECHEGFCSKLSGLSLKNITLSIFEQGKKKPLYAELGEMLFTHFGISGPLTLSASAHIRNADKKSYTAVIDLKPALSAEQLDKRILRDFSENLNRDIINSLDKLLPKSLIPVVVELSGIPPHTKVNQISRECRQSLISVIKGLILHITGFRPIEEAIITRGGIPVSEIDPKTMASRLVDGLYFAGELIDVDAYTGGFNLQIAFSTGYLAGTNAAKKIIGE